MIVWKIQNGSQRINHLMIVNLLMASKTGIRRRLLVPRLELMNLHLDMRPASNVRDAKDYN